MLKELIKLFVPLLRRELRKAKRRRGGGALTLVVVLTVAVFAIERFLHEPELPLPKPGSDLRCTPRKVADGDTVTVSCDGGRLTVRVWGIDAPESGQKPWGQASKTHLQRLLPAAGPVAVQVVDTDRYGRAVARLFADNEDLGLAMVAAGRAVVYEQYNDSASYRAAEADARRAGRGVWSEPGDQQDPAAWRKVNARR